MGVVDAPQWLLPAYVRSVKALGASAPTEQVRAAGERLIEMWVSPDRRFHDLKHVINMLARVDELADESHNPDVMRLATWYHGCVFSAATERTYSRNGGEDEEASAAYAHEDLAALGIPERVTERVCALIISLKRHNLEPGDIDALALSDADLGTLAVGPQEYKRYRELVRQEYEHIPDRDYLRARLEIVSRLLARESLFLSPLGQRWESAARENLEAERKRLVDGLAAIKDDDGAAGDIGPGTALSPADEPAAEPSVTQADVESAAEPQSAEAHPADVASPSTITSAHSAHTPAGPPRASTPPSPRHTEPTTKAQGGREDASRGLEHATSMESCIEDLDAILGSKRPGAQDAPLDRQAQAESERLRMAERLRLKAQEAKSLREARTGEIAPVTEEIIDDGAADL